jgi:hypothetical protein
VPQRYLKIDPKYEFEIDELLRGYFQAFACGASCAAALRACV